MITKEKLEELIKQKATIYGVNTGHIIKIKLNEESYIFKYNEDYFLNFENCANGIWREHYTLDCLFETKEEAEWALKTNITKEVKLPYIPMFEEIVQCGFQSCAINCTLRVVITDRRKHIELYQKNDLILFEDLTKENYIKAVDKFIELWKGEK